MTRSSALALAKRLVVPAGWVAVTMELDGYGQWEVRLLRLSKIYEFAIESSGKVKIWIEGCHHSEGELIGEMPPEICRRMTNANGSQTRR